MSHSKSHAIQLFGWFSNVYRAFGEIVGAPC
jgi:hypothetical protein